MIVSIQVLGDADLVRSVRKIKQRDSPPYKEEDPYYLRSPWNKFGGVSSGICMAWYWFRDDVILRKVTKEDVEQALLELRCAEERRV